MNNNSPLVALTFDDGPSSKVTRRILGLLRRYHIAATFSVIGKNAEQYPELLKKATAQGCELVNHSWWHERLTDLSDEQIEETIAKTDGVIRDASGEDTIFVRPPYGSSDDRVSKVLEKMGKAQLLWNADSRDWELETAEQIVEEMLNQMEDGSVVIMHDIYPSSYKALTILIPELQRRGFEFVTVSEMLKRKAVTVVPGAKYCRRSASDYISQ